MKNQNPTLQAKVIRAIELFGEDNVLRTELPSGSVYTLLVGVIPNVTTNQMYNAVNRLRRSGVVTVETVEPAEFGIGARAVSITKIREYDPAPVGRQPKHKDTKPWVKPEMTASEMTARLLAQRVGFRLDRAKRAAGRS